MGGGEVAGTAIEMGGRVTLKAKVTKAALRCFRLCISKAARSSRPRSIEFLHDLRTDRLGPRGQLPVFATYLGGEKIAPLPFSRDLKLAVRNTTLNMIDFLVNSKG